MKIEETIQVCELLDTYGAMLTEKQQQIVKDYYFCNTSLSEIAEICGITRQAVRDTLTRSVQTLREYDKKLGTLSKIGKIVKELEELKSSESSTMQKKKIQRIIDEIKE